MTVAPPAPWDLAGECLVAAVAARPAGDGAALPPGLNRIPGPTVVVAVRYTHSPVGPYFELAVGQPARLGMRPGLCITTMVVDSHEARIGGRLNWGFPKELGTLRWRRVGDEVSLTWDEGGFTITGRSAGIRVPAVLPLRALQQRSDGPVVVPSRVRGLARLCRAEIEAKPDGDLAPLAGRHVGLHVAGLHFAVHPARVAVGLTSTLRAPLRAPEPALSSRVQTGD